MPRVTGTFQQFGGYHLLEKIATGGMAEVYRGFHPLGVALSGAVGLLAAALQPWLVGDDPTGFVRYWLLVAAVAGGVGFTPALDAYLRREDAFARRRTTGTRP